MRLLTLLALSLVTLPALAETAQSSHADGYSWAEQNNIHSKSDCTGEGSFKGGCETFVDEQAANDMPPPTEEGSAPSAGTEDGSGPYEQQGDAYEGENESYSSVTPPAEE